MMASDRPSSVVNVKNFMHCMTISSYFRSIIFLLDVGNLQNMKFINFYILSGKQFEKEQKQRIEAFLQHFYLLLY